MDKSEKFWDKQAINYDMTEMKYEQNYIRALEKTRKYLNTSDVVLDYGCGTGITANELAGNVKEIHANDISSEMITTAKRKTSELNITNIEYAHATIFDERYEKESYNAVLAFNILHLLENSGAVMQRIHELLKPEGIFISTTACLGEKWSFMSILLFLLGKIGVVPYTNRFSVSELQGLITGANFQIIEAETLSHSPTNHFIVARKI